MRINGWRNGAYGFDGNQSEFIAYNTSLSTNSLNLVSQYQSAKWGIALTPPGTGATEVVQATAADGYSVFTTRYLERLSQSANISLQASNNITLDFKGDTLHFTTAARSLTLTAGNQITTASAGTITTNNGAISLTGTNGIAFNHAYTLNSGSAATTLTTSAGSITVPTINAGSIAITNGGATADITSTVAQLTATGAGGITLNSARDVNFSNTGLDSSALNGPVSITAARTAYLAPINTGTGNLTVNAQDVYVYGGDISSGLVGYWNFNEGSGTTAADSSGGGITGTLTNTPTWSSNTHGGSGYSLNFNGSNDYVALSSNPITGSNPFTLSAWINTATLSKYSGAVSLGGSNTGINAYIGTVLGAQVGTSSSIGGGIYGYNIGSGITSINQWNQVAMTYSGGVGGTLSLYVNGLLTQTGTYTPNLAASPASIGRIGTDTTYNFLGLVDDARIYNTALSSGAVSKLYNGTSWNVGTTNITATHDITLDLHGDTFATGTNKAITLTAANQITTASAGTITTGNGAITLNGPVTLGANFTTNSGSATTTFGSTVNGAYDLTATAGTFSFASPLGSATALGAVSLTSTNALSLRGITASSITASTVTGNIAGAGGLVTNGGNISLTAGTDVDLSAIGLITTNGNATLSGRDVILNTGINTGTGSLTVTASRDIFITKNDLSAGLAGYWKFDEGAGTTAIDSSSNGNTGTLTSSAYSANTPYGSGYSLNGASATVNIADANSLDIPNNLTISLWIKPTSSFVGYASQVISKWTGIADANFTMYYFGTTSGIDRYTGFIANAGGVWNGISQYSPVAPVGNWTNIALSYNSATGGQLYANGIAIGGLNAGGALAVNNALLKIGNLFPGLIDDVRVYNASLSATQVAQLYAPQVNWQTGATNLTAAHNVSLDLKNDVLNTSNGAALTLTAGNQITTASAGTITTNNGAIALTGTNGILINNNFGINSGGSAIAFNSPVDGAGALTVNSGAGTTSFASAVGASTALGGLNVAGAATIASNISTNNAAMTFNNAVTLGGVSVWNAGTGTITTGSTVNSTGNNLTLKADNMTIGGALSGSGQLFIAPGTNNRTMNFGAPAGGLDWDTTELSYISSAKSVTIGLWGTTTGDVNLGGFSLNNNTQIYNMGNLTISGAVDFLGRNLDIGLNSGDVDINAALTSAGGNLTIRSGAWGNSIALAGGAGNVTLTSAQLDNITDGWSLITFGNGGQAITLGAYSNWRDPVNFNSGTGAGATVTVNGTQSTTAASNAKFTFSGPTTFNANVDTSAATGGTRAILLQNFSHTLGANLLSGGGDITLGGATLLSGAGARTVNAGTGALAISNTINGNSDFTAMAATITSSGAWGGITPLGNVTLTSTNAISLPAITTTAGKTVSVNVTGAGNSITTSGAIATGAAGNITLTADDLILGANLSGTGTLTLQPNATSRVVDVNYGVADGTNFNLSTTEIGYLVDGWSGINVGNTGTVTDTFLGASTWTDPVTFRNNLRTTLYGNLTGTGNAALGFNVGWIDANTYTLTTAAQQVLFNTAHPLGIVAQGMTVNSNGGNITFNTISTSGGGLVANSAGGAIAVNGAITNTAAITGMNLLFNAGAGAMSFGSTVNSNNNITATADSIAFNGAWGSIAPLGNVTLTSTNGISLPAITTTAGKTVNVNVSGAGNSITTTGAIATGAAGNLTLTADDLILGANLSGTGTLTLQPNATSRVVNVNNGFADGLNFNLSTAELVYLVDGWSGINIGRTDSIANTNIGNASWTDPVTFQSPSTIYPDGSIIGSGNASFTFLGTVYGRNGSIVTAAQDVTFVNMVAEKGYTITTNGGSINNNGTLSIQYGFAWNTLDSVSYNSAGGNINIGGGILKSNANGVGKNIVLNAGAGNLNIGGTTNIAGDINATAGSINLNGFVWGGTTPLGAVSLTSTNGLTLPSITAASVVARTTGAGSDITLGAGKVLSASGAGTAITLAAGRNFVNSSGSATPFSLSGGGRWLAYSTNPAADTLAGITSSFVRYGCIYGGACPAGVSIPGAGNGFVYAYQPTLTITPTALAALTYGDATPSLTGYAYGVSGYLTGAAGSESGADTLGGALTGSTTYLPTSIVGSYNVNYASGTLTSALGYQFSYANHASAISVGKKQLTATANDRTITYGTSVPASSVSYTGFVNGEGSGVIDTLASVSSVESGIVNAGTYAGNYTASGALDNNYSFTYASGDLLVNKQDLTVTAADRTIIYGDAIPLSSLSYSGFIAGEDTSFLGTVPTVGSARSGLVSAGSYANNYMGTGGVSGNYLFHYSGGTLDVLAIVAPPLPALPSTVEYSMQMPFYRIAATGDDLRAPSITYVIGDSASPNADSSTGNEETDSAEGRSYHSYSATIGANELTINPALAKLLDLSTNDIEKL